MVSGIIFFKRMMSGTDKPKSIMTLVERFEFLALPISLLILSIPIVIAPILILLLLILHPRIMDRNWLTALAETGAIALIIASYPYVFFRKMIHHKRNTGKFLLFGEELEAYRLRRKNPPLWKKVAVLLLLFYIAFETTYDFLKSPHSKTWFWIIPVLMWIIAIVFTLGLFILKKSKWLFVILTISFCLMAISSTYFNLAKLYHNEPNWFFPITMWVITTIFAIGIIQSTIQERNSPVAEDMQMPSEAS
ncbi:MAG: hypothetical protein WB424_11400 [Terracidiphilus sp.]